MVLAKRGEKGGRRAGVAQPSSRCAFGDRDRDLASDLGKCTMGSTDLALLSLRLCPVRLGRQQ